MVQRPKCLVRRHDWHSEYDPERQLTRWSCRRCGAKKHSYDEFWNGPTARNLGGV